MEDQEKSLRQASFWFGKGATSRLDLATGSYAEEERHDEDRAFAQLAAEERSQIHIYFVVDCTGSMGEYLIALREMLSQLNAVLMVLFPGGKADISIIAYKDYSEKTVLVQRKNKVDLEKLEKFVERLQPSGGGM